MLVLPLPTEQIDEILLRPPLSRDDLGDVLRIATRAGQLMLENGANTARVEETIHHIGTALGAQGLDVYVTPSGIIASATSHGEHRTLTQRVVKSGIDLSRFAAVLELSRRATVGGLGRPEVRAELERIAVQPRVYAHWLTVLAVASACTCFAALFGAGPREALAVFVAAGIAQQVRAWLAPINLSRMLATGIVAALASGLALTLAHLLGSTTPGPAVLGSVLLLVPGVLMVSSVSDLFRGDTISGIARATSAFLLLGATSAGIWTVLLVDGAGMDLGPISPPPALAAIGFALVAAAGFAILFDVPRYVLLVSAIVGALAYGARLAALAFGWPPEPAIFLAGVVIGVLAELLARVYRAPTSLFTIPGFITLVPGAAAFRTLLAFVNADYTAGTAGLVRTALLITAMAAGLGTVSALARVRQKPL